MVLLQALVVQVQLRHISQTQVVHTAWHLQHNAKVNTLVQLKAPELVKQAVTKLPGPTITTGLIGLHFAVYNKSIHQPVGWRYKAVSKPCLLVTRGK